MQIIRSVQFRTQKKDESISDCQDACCALGSCFAVADGASQSLYPNIWADGLVKHFCKNPGISQENWQDWLFPIQEEWLLNVSERIANARKSNKASWITSQNRFNSFEPATSTFIGLKFIEEENQVDVCIVGDSCLFLLEDGQLVKTFPLNKSSDFGDRPAYFASRVQNNEFIPDFLTFKTDANDTTEHRNHFILATDALAEFIFRKIEYGEDLQFFLDLLKISSPEDFERFVAMSRQTGPIKMKNDDVTLTVIEVLCKGELKILGQAKNTSQANESKFTRREASPQKIFTEMILPQLLTTHEEPPTTMRPPKPRTYSTEGSFPKKLSKNIKFSLNSISSHLRLNRKSVRNKESDGSSSSLENLKKLRKENLSLKQQRFLLILSFVILFLVFLSWRDEYNKIFSSSMKFLTSELGAYNPNRPIEMLEKGTVIYKNKSLEPFLKEPIPNSIPVTILDKQGDFKEFEIDLYVFQSTSSSSNNQCPNQKIPIGSQPVRTLPDNAPNTSFGTLKEPFEFVKLGELSNWCKFKFRGYVKQ